MSSPNTSQNPNPSSPQILKNTQYKKSKLFSSKSHSKSHKKGFNKIKLQAIEKKVQSLTKTLNPIPFKPSKTLNFTLHENLLKKLGLWDFIHIEYDKNIRIDLITQLIVTYEAKKQCGYVNGYKINVNKSALGNALKLSTEKIKNEKVCDIVYLDTYDGEKTSFIESLVSSYLILCDLVPNNVLVMTSGIKSGHFEKVDWVGIIFGMVIKEISLGVKLENCWYASHLQCLIKDQNKDDFVFEEKQVFLHDEKVLDEVNEVLNDQNKDVFVFDEKEVVDEVKEGMEKDKAIELNAQYKDVLLLDEEEVLDDVKEGMEKDKAIELNAQYKDVLLLDEEEVLDDVKEGMEKDKVIELGDELCLGEENVEKEEEMDMMVVEESKVDVGKGDFLLEEKEVFDEVKEGMGLDKVIIELDSESGVEEYSVELNLGQENGEKVLDEVKEGMGFDKVIELDGESIIVDESKVDVFLLDEEEEGMGLNKAIKLDSDSVVVEEPIVELNLGKENVEKEEEMDVKETNEVDRDMMVVDESKVDVGKGDWILDGKDLTGGHFLQSCNMKEDMPKHVGEKSKDDVVQGKFGFDGEDFTGVPVLQSCNVIEVVVMDANEKSESEKEGVRNFEDMVTDADEKSKLGKKGERNFDDLVMDADEKSKLKKEGERSFEDEGEMVSDEGEEDGMKIDEEDDDVDDDEEEEDEMNLNEGDDEEKDDHEYSLAPRMHGLGNDGYAGNLLQAIDSNHLAYNVSGQFDDQFNMGIISPRAEPYSSSGGPSFFGNGMKRAISHDHDLLQDHLGGVSKRPRIDGSSSEPDFDTCMDQIQFWVGKAKDKYEGKRKDVEELSKNQQFWMNEVQQRAQLIEHLQKVKYEELQKKDVEIYRLDRELFVMGNLINGYRDALKATDKKFAEYKKRAQLPEEPIYKDVGPGGLVLSTMEIERLRLMREEEDRVTRVIWEQNVKQLEEGYMVTLEGYLNQVQMMDTKLLDFEKKVSQLKARKCKVSETVDSAVPME